MQAGATGRRARSDRGLLLGLAARNPIALADACARSLPAAAAVCRRLLPAADLEPTIEAVFRALWHEPPRADAALVGWVRARCFALGVETLRARGEAPAAPSVAAAAPDLPSAASAYRDATERALAALDDASRRAVVRAHDAGLPHTLHDAAGPHTPAPPAHLQEPPGLPHPLLHGLLSLAGRADTPLPDVDSRVGDLVLGLLGTDEAAEVAAGVRVLGPVRANELLHALRRGRQRLEGLAPPPELGLRVLARILTTGPTSARSGGLRADSLGEEAQAGVATAKADVRDTGSERPDRASAQHPPPDIVAPEETTDRPATDRRGSQTTSASRHRPRHARPAARRLGEVLLILVGAAVGLFVVGPLLLELLARLGG